jgi:hypothetical protein
MVKAAMNMVYQDACAALEEEMPEQASSIEDVLLRVIKRATKKVVDDLQ